MVNIKAYKCNYITFPWEYSQYTIIYTLQKLKSAYWKGIKSADVMGVVQHHVYFFFYYDNTVKIKFLRKIKLLGHNGHLDEKCCS